jgi:hypothetical protein
MTSRDALGESRRSPFLTAEHRGDQQDDQPDARADHQYRR